MDKRSREELENARFNPALAFFLLFPSSLTGKKFSATMIEKHESSWIYSNETIFQTFFLLCQYFKETSDELPGNFYRKILTILGRKILIRRENELKKFSEKSKFNDTIHKFFQH